MFMHLDKRFALVMAGSLLWAFLVAAVFHRVTAGAGRGADNPKSKPLVVAAQPLPLGAVIGADSIKTVQVPEDLFPKGGFSKKEDVLERPVVSPIQADEPVVEARIAARGSGMGLGPMIPPGMRAVSVRVNDVVGVAGFVLPGMRVDVLVTGHPPGRDDTVTTTVLQNIPVLSAGTSLQPDAKGQPISATVVTLLVTPTQAEALTLASSEGRLQLVLRNTTDQQVAPTSGRRLHDLYGVATTPEPRAVPPPESPRPVRPPAAPRPAASQPVPAAAPSTARVPEEVILIRGAQKTVEAVPRMNY
jgi:pilus assembly protein CpaB